MKRTISILKHNIPNEPTLNQPKFIFRSSKPLKPGRIRSPFHIAWGGIDEGIYKKDNIEIYNEECTLNKPCVSKRICKNNPKCTLHK
tara:strand:+ start:1464 stop:1724 length:261 start_codon:yes stop_codon:yes gene_type:complete